MPKLWSQLQQRPVPGGVGGERLDAKQAADVVEGGGDMDVEVGVDPSGDLICMVVRFVPSLAGWGYTSGPERRTRQRRAFATGS